MLQAQAKIDSAEVLRQAEKKRAPWENMSLIAQITDSTAAIPAATYHVLLSDDNALVIFKKPETTKGNLLLMQKNDLWLYIGGTKQPAKITALQRLSGAVSYVDLARLNWSEDYKISSLGNMPLKMFQNEYETFLLHLVALSKENAYQKIDLWVNKQNKRPLQADIYLASGRKFKTIQFSKYETIGDKDINTQIVFTDHFAGNKQSVISYSDIKKEKMFPAYYFIKDSLPAVSREMRR